MRWDIMRLNVAVCDDERIICNEIKNRLYGMFPDYLVDIYDSGTSLLESGKYYDLIFLDIEMPNMNGMVTAEQLREKDHGEYIIFLTSHSEYMPEAFKVKAFRFLEKPIDGMKFFEALSCAEKEILSNEKIAIKEKGCTTLVSYNDIVCIEAYGDGTFVYTKYGIVVSLKSLKYWSDRLGSEHFYQVHKSYLVAFRYVKNIYATTIELHYMKERVPVSRRRLSQFKLLFYDYVKRNSRCL